MTQGWKIVQVVALVREDDAEDVHHGYAKMTEYDQSRGAWVETRDLTDGEALDFGEAIEGDEEES